VEDYQKKFLELSLNAKVLEFGDFTLKSGRQSPYFFNAARMLNGGYLYELAECYKNAINAANLKFDCIYGPADKDGFKYPLSFDRKEIKDHGEGGTIIGNNPSGDVLIVDDVISAGTAAKESIKMIKSTGATPKIMIVGLDRQERGSGNLSARRELEEEFGMQVISIINLDTLITYSQSNSGYETHLERLQAYRNEWGA
jgi:orotate phosphoribosyltransferase